MDSHFLFRCCAVFSTVLLASAAFAQIGLQPDAPQPVPTTPGPGLSAADRDAITRLIAPAMDATNQAVTVLSSAVGPLASRHSTVESALAAANASAAVTNCVMSYHARESADATAKVRAAVAKLKDQLAKQRAAALAAWMKMQSQQRTASGAPDPASSESALRDIGAMFDQMAQSVDIAQAKMLASLR